MDVFAQCYNVLPQLDINNTIDHRPEGDEKWFLENEKTVTQFCRKLAAERPLKDIRDEYNYPKKKGIKDECSRLLDFSFQAEDGIRDLTVTGVQTCALPIFWSSGRMDRSFMVTDGRGRPSRTLSKFLRSRRIGPYLVDSLSSGRPSSCQPLSCDSTDRKSVV